MESISFIFSFCVVMSLLPELKMKTQTKKVRQSFKQKLTLEIDILNQSCMVVPVMFVCKKRRK